MDSGEEVLISQVIDKDGDHNQGRNIDVLNMLTRRENVNPNFKF